MKYRCCVMIPGERRSPGMGFKLLLCHRPESVIRDPTSWMLDIPALLIRTYFSSYQPVPTPFFHS